MVDKILSFGNNLKNISETPNSNSIAEKMEQLFPSVWIMIATLGSLCLLLIILTFFLYKPVTKMVQRRKDFIKKNIDESIKARKEALNIENKANTKLIEVKKTSNDIISKSIIEAEAIKNNYIEQGKHEAARIIKEAKDEINLRKKELETQTYNEIVSVAIEISEQILKDKITKKETRKYLDDYLNNDYLRKN